MVCAPPSQIIRRIAIDASKCSPGEIDICDRSCLLWRCKQSSIFSIMWEKANIQHWGQEPQSRQVTWYAFWNVCRWVWVYRNVDLVDRNASMSVDKYLYCVASAATNEVASHVVRFFASSMYDSTNRQLCVYCRNADTRLMVWGSGIVVRWVMTGRSDNKHDWSNIRTLLNSVRAAYFRLSTNH